MKLTLFLLLSVLFSSCSQEEGPGIESAITGKWKLIEFLSDPGDGSGVFQPATIDKTITFFSDLTFESSSSMCNLNDGGSQGYYDPETMIITPENCTFQITYKLENSKLILYYPCKEPCAEKYEKVE